MCAELCEGSSYTAKIPNLLLSKRMGFVGLGFFYTNKIFQSAKQIPALEVEIGHKCCLFSPWFCWNSHVEVSQPHSPLAAVPACVSVMGRRAGLPPQVIIPLAASVQSLALKVSKSWASNHF